MKDNQGDWVHELQNSLRPSSAELHTSLYYCLITASDHAERQDVADSLDGRASGAR